jgi:hypothetical protein
MWLSEKHITGRIEMALAFEPIDLNRQALYRERLAQCSQIASDYSFVNLWGWGENYGLAWAWDEHLVWLRQSRPYPALWAPVGPWHSIDWRDKLTNESLDDMPLVRIPEALMDQWRHSQMPTLRISEAREHWDYLYSREELVSLKGNRFHKKKNLVNQFEKSYDYRYHTFSPRMVARALDMQDTWCTWRDCDNNDMLTAENTAIARILADWRQLPGLTGGALEVDGSLIAYTIAEVLPDDTLVIHIEKGSPDYKGCYQAINQMFLAHAPERCEVVNREQDLGDEGLRQAKLSYQPTGFIKKFTVTV